MLKRVSYVLMGSTALLSALTLGGCKEDPPPPPVQTADTATTANPQTAGSMGVTRPPGRNAVPRVEAETTKVSRVEACYWGSFGLGITRDAYLASTKDGAPTAAKLPSFGEFPEFAKRAEAMKKAGREQKAEAINLPYLRHLRACKHALSATGVKMEGVDEALAAWEPYASKLHETLVKATRYFGREAFKKDDFKEGNAYHATLAELLPQYDEKLAAFTKAINTWHAAHADWAPKDELDEGGKVAHEALQKSRQLTEMLLSDSRDQAAFDKLLGEVKGLQAELETLRQEQRRPPHPKVVGPKLQEFVAAATAAGAVEGKLSATQLYPITSSLALLFELNQRSLEQLLRQRSAVNKKPMRGIDLRDQGPADEGTKPDNQRVRGGLRQQ